MSALTGLGPIETGLLESYDTIGAHPNHPHVKNSRVLRELSQTHGIAPHFGFTMICSTARPDLTHLSWIDFHGNYGSPDFGTAAARYTESRLSPLGEAALRAERGERPPLPIGLINGSTQFGGDAPPFDPQRIVTALLAACDGASDAELTDTVGPPCFPTRCHVIVDLSELAAGRQTTVRCEAHIEPSDRPNELLISRLPPRSSASAIGSMLERRFRKEGIAAFPVADINEDSSGGVSRIVVNLIDGADPDMVTRQLVETWGVHTTAEVALDAPVPAIIRRWIADHGTADLEDQLQPIIDAAQ